MEDRGIRTRQVQVESRKREHRKVEKGGARRGAAKQCEAKKRRYTQLQRGSAPPPPLNCLKFASQLLVVSNYRGRLKEINTKLLPQN